MFREEPVGPAPSWFVSALSRTPEHLNVTVDGCRIHLRAWGARDRPPIVFVHGGAAHAGWWDHIAPFFAASHRVIAVDLSGHGDSEFRDSYGLHTWAREVLAAASFAGSSHLPTVVGHSMGGWVAARVARQYGDQIDAVVIIDSPLWNHAPEEPRLRRHSQRKPGRRSRDDLIARFAPVPAQETVLPFIARHIAGESIRRTLRGWDWKFDRAIFSMPLLDRQRADEELMERIFAEMPCRVAYLRCEAGVVPVDMADDVRSFMQLRGPFIELAEAGHHPMLDQPLALVATLRTLLEMWSIT